MRSLRMVLIALIALLLTMITTLLSVLVTGEASADTIAQAVMTGVAAISTGIVVTEYLVNRRDDSDDNGPGPSL